MKYRKKPVAIEAFHLKDLSYKTVSEALIFMGQSVITPRTPIINQFNDYITSVWLNDGIKIETLEGMLLARSGDYIIKGVQGEFYPCKPDIFEQTHERVEDEK